MKSESSSIRDVIRHPSALLPIAMSLTALCVVGVAALWTVAQTGHGLVREPDEGAAAHLWQILMAGQLPVLAFFAFKWLRRAPRASIAIVGLQLAAALAACAPVYLLGL